jgi:arabinofuranosyltransferase
MLRARRIVLPLAVFFTVVCLLYSSFTAEDAYIASRYATNLAQSGALVFNEGERICALTSPLHALVESLLDLVFGDPLVPYKVLSLLALLASMWLLFRLFRDSVSAQVGVVLAMVLSPSVILWTFGGLETPLLLFLVTALAALAYRVDELDLKTMCVLHFLAGAAVVTRYDSVLFVLPLVLWSWTRARRLSRILPAAAAGIVLPLAWFVFSAVYYQDVLPTSFYVKTPSFSPAVARVNGLYIAEHLVLVGMVPYLIFLVRQSRPGEWWRIVREQARAVWWLQIGLGAMLLYGLTSATTHMMFSFRYFVPYLPATAVLLGDLARRRDAFAGREVTHNPKPARYGLLLWMMFAFQVFQAGWTYTRSLDGLSLLGEYRRIGARDYAGRFVPALALNAEDTRAHWTSLGETRPPRISTFAAGMLPYTYREAYIYEKLVSFRFNCRYDLRTSADYLHIMTPRHGSVEYQLVKPIDEYELVSSHTRFFDGRSETLMVFYNPAPAPNRLPPGIRDPCLE